MNNNKNSVCLRYFGLAALLASTASCSLMPARKVWDTAQASAVGMPEEKLLSCMGEPATKRQSGSVTSYLYGYRVMFSDGAAWCIVDFQTNGGKVVRMSKRSGFPGSVVNGDWVCGHVVEPCFGDGTLPDATANLPDFLDQARMTDVVAEATQAQTLGIAGSTAALNNATALAGAINSVSSPRPTTTANLLPSIAASSNASASRNPSAPRQTPPTREGVPRSQSSSPKGAAPNAEPATVSNPVSSTAIESAQESKISVTLSDQLVSNGVYNLWRIRAANSSPFSVRCFISATYRFSDPNGTGKLVSDSATRTVNIPARGYANADYGFNDRNVQTDSYRLMSCAKT